MPMIAKNKLVLPLVAVMIFFSGAALADQTLDWGAADGEIGIGNIMPDPASVAAFSTIGNTEAAYFDMINERGGVNGRKIKFISYDDGSDPGVGLGKSKGSGEI